ncbi:MAG TPA: DapH/DapD/GlmU-related protein [Candidatus Deferrimicrobium sp.]|nr:DapH/DapD/GlmU-related protein [Candidatus Deferrimicrobium sp.]
MRVPQNFKKIFEMFPILKNTTYLTPLFTDTKDAETEPDRRRIEDFQKTMTRQVYRNAKRSKEYEGQATKKYRRTFTANVKERKWYRLTQSIFRWPQILARLRVLQYGLPSIKAAYLDYLGAHIGKDVMITVGNTLDPYFPEKITIGDNSILGMGSSILCHEILDGELRVGDVEIGKNTLICAGCFILPGVTVGDNCIVSPGVLSSDVEDNTFAIGEPENIRHKMSKPVHLEAVKKKRRVKKTGLTLHDWRKIKNPFEALITNLILEFQRNPMPQQIRQALLRLVGIQVGKNVFIDDEVLFDGWYPELISIDDNAHIRKHVALATHEGMVGAFRKGPIHIGKQVLVGAGGGILPGVEIGDDSEVLPFAFVASDIKPRTRVEGIPAHEVGTTFNFESFTEEKFSYARDVWEEIVKTKKDSKKES